MHPPSGPAWLVWLETSGVAVAMRQWTWLYPAVEIAHIVGFVTLVGAALMFDARLLGRSRPLAVSALERHLLPWARWSLLLVVPTGALMFAAHATEMATNPAFRLKLVLLVAAFLNAGVVCSPGAGLAALGLGADEVVGLSLSDHLGTRDPDDPTLAVHRAALAGVATVYELRHEGRVYQVHVEPWRAGSDGIVGALGVALDISGRARAETALLRSERTLAEFFENAEAEFFENAAMGLHWIGPDGTILRANQAELDLLGYGREEYVGHHIAEFHVDPEPITEILTRLGRGETVDAWEART